MEDEKCVVSYIELLTKGKNEIYDYVIKEKTLQVHLGDQRIAYVDKNKLGMRMVWLGMLKLYQI